MTREIPLTKGYVALVDDEDYQRLTTHKWQFGGRYAHRTIGTGADKHIELMHRLVLNAPAGMMVDHVNGNMLDNRKTNLRLCSQSQNCANARKRKSLTSQYKGVSRYTKNPNTPWQAAIKKNGKGVSLGRFPTEEAAAHAYDTAAKKLFGEYAYLNFPEQPDTQAA